MRTSLLGLAVPRAMPERTWLSIFPEPRPPTRTPTWTQALTLCRAIAYAISQGVSIVAAAGNDNVDLGHLSGMHDISSPNNGNPIARKINNVRPVAEVSSASGDSCNSCRLC